jgi:hypothetical protein
MSNEPVAYINVEERRLQWAGPVKWDTPIIAKMDKIPLYTHPVKEQELLGEIAQLKAELDTANKAYMWMDETYKGVLVELDLLKAHPVKELTDEEIKEVATINLGHSMGLLNWMGFARAILRKAQEK